MFWLRAISSSADVEAAKVFEREIDAALGVVDADVLPEVGELQGRAGEVGKLLALGVAISAEVEHEMADGIGGVAAVGQHVIEGFEAGDGLILAEGDEQVREFVFGNVELADGFSQGDEDRMSWHACRSRRRVRAPTGPAVRGRRRCRRLRRPGRRRCGSRRRH